MPWRMWCTRRCYMMIAEQSVVLSCSRVMVVVKLPSVVYAQCWRRQHGRRRSWYTSALHTFLPCWRFQSVSCCIHLLGDSSGFCDSGVRRGEEKKANIKTTIGMPTRASFRHFRCWADDGSCDNWVVIPCVVYLQYSWPCGRHGLADPDRTVIVMCSHSVHRS